MSIVSPSCTLTGTLKVTKELEGISNIDDVFKFKVTIDNEVMTPGGLFEDGHAYIQYELENQLEKKQTRVYFIFIPQRRDG